MQKIQAHLDEIEQKLRQARAMPQLYAFSLLGEVFTGEVEIKYGDWTIVSHPQRYQCNRTTIRKATDKEKSHWQCLNEIANETIQNLNALKKQFTIALIKQEEISNE